MVHRTTTFRDAWPIWIWEAGGQVLAWQAPTRRDLLWASKIRTGTRLSTVNIQRVHTPHLPGRIKIRTNHSRLHKIKATVFRSGVTTALFRP